MQKYSTVRKNLNLTAIFATIAIFILAACSNNENTVLKFSGQLVEHSICKDFEISEAFQSDDVPANVSQVDYSFDAATNKLTLKHFNAGFNCCPDGLYSNISLVNDTILIQEFEVITEPCRCLCLYDLDMLITGVESKKYTVKIIEPYYQGDQKIIFDIDLREITNGSFSVERDEYPWGIIE